MPPDFDQTGQNYQLAAQGSTPTMAKQTAIGSNSAASAMRAQQLHDSAAKSSQSSMSRAKMYLAKTIGGENKNQPAPTPGIQST